MALTSEMLLTSALASMASSLDSSAVKKLAVVASKTDELEWPWRADVLAATADAAQAAERTAEQAEKEAAKLAGDAESAFEKLTALQEKTAEGEAIAEAKAVAREAQAQADHAAVTSRQAQAKAVHARKKSEEVG